MVKSLIAFLLVIFLSACASTQDYEAHLSSWVGQSEQALVAKWGAPDNVYISPDKSRILTYQKDKIVTKTNLFYYPSIEEPYTPTIEQLSCKTSFTIKEGKIIQWRWEGNNCSA